MLVVAPLLDGLKFHVTDGVADRDVPDWVARAVRGLRRATCEATNPASTRALVYVDCDVPEGSTRLRQLKVRRCSAQTVDRILSECCDACEAGDVRPGLVVDGTPTRCAAAREAMPPGGEWFRVLFESAASMEEVHRAVESEELPRRVFAARFLAFLLETIRERDDRLDSDASVLRALRGALRDTRVP